MLPVMVMVGITPDADVSKVTDQRVTSSPRAYQPVEKILRDFFQE